MAKTDEQIERSRSLLDNPGFTSKAPEAVVTREKEKLEQLIDRRRQLAENLQEL
jgi:valyl-tRNA synthetase